MMRAVLGHLGGFLSSVHTRTYGPLLWAPSPLEHRYEPPIDEAWAHVSGLFKEGLQAHARAAGNVLESGLQPRAV